MKLPRVDQGGEVFAVVDLVAQAFGAFDDGPDGGVVNRRSSLTYERRAISTPSAKSAQLRGLELSLRDILTRIPELDSLHRMTFGEEALTARLLFSQDRVEDDLFELTLVHSQKFSDRESLKPYCWRVSHKISLLEGLARA